MLRTSTFYIDESGNTGDAVFRHNEYTNLHEQPYFSLACIGMSKTEDHLEERVREFKSKHRIRGSELKSSVLYNKKPEFLIDLLNSLLENEYPIFVELIDKKYNVSINIVNSLIVPLTNGQQLDEQFKNQINFFADLIYYNFEEYVFTAFCDVCLFPREENFTELLSLLSNEIKKNIKKTHFGNLRNSFEKTRFDYEMTRQLTRDQHRDIHKRFLPLPDYNRRGEILAMLPNTIAFANLYARINKYRTDESLDQISLVHDEQKHFEGLFRSHKFWLDANEPPEKLNSLLDSSVNFHFNQNTSLEFRKSKHDLGLQLADLLAGFVMRYFKDFDLGKTMALTKYGPAFKRLIALHDFEDSFGINMVAPQKKIDELPLQ